MESKIQHLFVLTPFHTHKNCTCRDGWNDYLINKTTVEVGTCNLKGTGMIYMDFCSRTQLETYSPSNWDYFRNVPIGWVNCETFYGANLTATDGPCKYTRRVLVAMW